MATVTELKKFIADANEEFDELTKWMMTTGFKTAPKTIQRYSSVHSQSLLEEIEMYKADISRRTK